MNSAYILEKTYIITIVLNDYKVIHEAAVINRKNFSGRPTALSNEVTGGKNGVVSAKGALWKNQQRFVHVCLQQFGIRKPSFEGKTLKEVDCFINALKAECSRPTDFRERIHVSVANVILSIVCGKRHDYGNEQFQQLLQETDIFVNHVLKVSIMLSCAPFLRSSVHETFERYPY